MLFFPVFFLSFSFSFLFSTWEKGKGCSDNIPHKKRPQGNRRVVRCSWCAVLFSMRLSCTVSELRSGSDIFFLFSIFVCFCRRRFLRVLYYRHAPRKIPPKKEIQTKHLLGLGACVCCTSKRREWEFQFKPLRALNRGKKHTHTTFVTIRCEMTNPTIFSLFISLLILPSLCAPPACPLFKIRCRV